MIAYWKRFDKEEREAKKRAEREAIEQRKRDEEIREARRQQLKLNYLLTQTELFSHFVRSKTVGNESTVSAEATTDTSSGTLALAVATEKAVSSSVDCGEQDELHDWKTLGTHTHTGAPTNSAPALFSCDHPCGYCRRSTTIGGLLCGECDEGDRGGDSQADAEDKSVRRRGEEDQRRQLK